MGRLAVLIILAACGSSNPSLSEPVAISNVALAPVPPEPPAQEQLALAALQLKWLFGRGAAKFVNFSPTGNLQCVVASARAQNGEVLPRQFVELQVDEVPAYAAWLEIESAFDERCDVPAETEDVYIFRIAFRTDDRSVQTLSLRVSSDGDNNLYRAESFEYSDDLGREFLVDDEGQQVPPQASQP